MTLQQLLYVIEIAKTGSINQAAQSLYVSQSSLSSALKELENSLGISIFQRSNKGVQVTKEGTEFLKHAKALVERVQWLEDNYHPKMELSRVMQVSSAHYSFVSEAFIELLNQEQTQHTQLTLRNVSIHQVIQDVYERTSDIGIITINQQSQVLLHHLLQQYNLEFHPLIELEPHIFIHKNHPLAKKKQITEKDLSDYPYLCFELPPDVSNDFCEELQSYQLPKPSQIITINDQNAAMRILAKTNAYTTGTGLLLNHHDADVISTSFQCKERLQLGWIKNKNQDMNDLHEVFLTSLQKWLGCCMEMIQS